MNLRMQSGFLGTNADLLADLTLLAYILILLPLMVVGYYYARRKRFEPQHKTVMTTITLVNWVLILLVMVSSFTFAVAPAIPEGLSDRAILLPTIHVITGGLAQVIATYLLARMWLEKQLPEWLKIKNIKIYMRFTLTLWVVTALLGIAIYFTWYSATPTSAGDDVPAPVSTEDAGEGAPDPVSTEDEAAEDAPAPVSTEDEVMDEEAQEDAPDPVSTEDEVVDEDADADAPDPVSTEDETADEDAEGAPDPVSTEDETES